MINLAMIVQEPVQATIWYALNHYAYSDAIFLAQRLHAEVSSEESLYLLSTCYYRSGKTNSAYAILSSNACHSPQCRILFARCCLELNKYLEAETALLTNIRPSNDRSSNKTPVTIEELVKEFGESASFAAQLLGSICVKNERHSNAAHYYLQSLKVNPFLWSSFEQLVQLGERVDIHELFNISNIDFNLCHGNNPLVNLWNANNKPNESASYINTVNTKLANLNKYEINSPFAVIKSTADNGSIDVITPESNVWVTTTCLAPQKNGPFNKMTRKPSPKMKNENVTPNTVTVNNQFTPSGRFNFGVFPLNDAPLTIDSLANTTLDFEKSHSADSSLIARPAVRKPQTRRSQQNLQVQQTGVGTRSRAPKLQNVNNQLGIGENVSGSITIPSSIAVSPIQHRQSEQTQNLRRSSRLFSSSNSVKENSKAPVKLTRPRTPTKRTKRTNSSTAISTVTNASSHQQKDKESELNELNKPESKGNFLSENDIIQTGIKMQKASAKGLLDLLRSFGNALLHLSQFNCQTAIDALMELPGKHLNTGWGLTALGRAYFEMTQYDEAVKYFSEAHRVEPFSLQGMEYYSTALWHLQREVELSMLAQELIDFDKSAPQTWCAAGNCFSLQKEHETSIKFLQRAIQVDHDFAYAYTLLGHEYALTEEMDHAMNCFRNATRIDPRHYNAWYGIGMIYYKQEKFTLADLHYRKALNISPNSPVLMCHIGVVQHALKNSEIALQTLNKAIDMDSNNALCKFHRASIYFAIDKHKEALNELEQLKQIVPNESLVYFLIGKVHKKIGNTDLALMNFSWAMDLDPKGANNQIKEVIDKKYANDDDEVVVHSDANDSNDSIDSHGGGDERSRHGSTSSMEADDDDTADGDMIDESI